MSCILLFEKKNYPNRGVYVIVNNCITCFPNIEIIFNTHLITKDCREKLKNKMVRSNISDNQMARMLEDCIGKHYSDFIARVINYEHDRNLRQEREKKSQWITDVTNDMVLTVEKHIDFRANSFSVRMSLRQLPYEKQVNYVKHNKRKLYDVLIKYLSENKSAMKKIGDFNFYYVSNITVTRASEVEFLFSLKPGIEEELQLLIF